MKSDRYFSRNFRLFHSAHTYAFILLFCIFTANHGSKAQDLYVKQKNDTQTNFKLDDITKLTFSDGNLIINSKIGNPTTYPLSEIRYFNFKDLTSVCPENKVLADDLLILYPNPSYNRLIIQHKSEDFEPNSIEIVNLTGTVLFSHSALESNKSRQIDIDISSLPEGIYFCRVQAGHTFVTKKFIKK